MIGAWPRSGAYTSRSAPRPAGPAGATCADEFFTEGIGEIVAFVPVPRSCRCRIRAGLVGHRLGAVDETGVRETRTAAGARRATGTWSVMVRWPASSGLA
jgi:hypothetical protein